MDAQCNDTIMNDLEQVTLIKSILLTITDWAYLMILPIANPKPCPASMIIQLIGFYQKHNVGHKYHQYTSGFVEISPSLNL